MNGIATRGKRNQRGATLAEAAITSLTLFTLVLGVIDFGRAYSMFQNLTDAAREGARYAVAPDPTTETLPSSSEVQSHVAPYLSSMNVSGAVTMTSTAHTINGVSNTYTKVTVTAPYRFLFFSLGTVNITSNAEMRNETN